MSLRKSRQTESFIYPWCTRYRSIYATDLHKGSIQAIYQYTKLELRVLLAHICAAFGQQRHKVDRELNIIEE